MRCKNVVTLWFFCALTIFTLTDGNACNLKAKVGDSVSIDLNYQLKDKDELKWKFDESNLIYRKNKGKVIKSDQRVASNGNLQFSDVKMTDKGSYTVEIYFENGTSIRPSKTYIFCVYEKLSKPAVNSSCDSGKATLTCNVKSAEGQIITWYENGKKRGTSPTLPNIYPNSKAKYKCLVKNEVEEVPSEEIPVTCGPETTTDSVNTLFGFDYWIMVGILAGGGGLVLLLVIVLITCACHSCKRREKLKEDEEEFRLNTLHAPLSGQQRSKNTARGQPAPPIPEDDLKQPESPSPVQSKPKHQTRVRPPPPPLDNYEQPPPLPQPRKKGRKSEGPLYLQP